MLLFLHFQKVLVQKIKEEEEEVVLLEGGEEEQNVIVLLLKIANIIQKLKCLFHSILNPFYNYLLQNLIYIRKYTWQNFESSNKAIIPLWYFSNFLLLQLKSIKFCWFNSTFNLSFSPIQCYPKCSLASFYNSFYLIL